MTFQFMPSRALLTVTIDLTILKDANTCFASNDNSDPLIKNEGNKIVPTWSLMFNVLVEEI
jgi:hypothetical protein